jgi:hypothetical protein
MKINKQTRAANMAMKKIFENENLLIKSMKIVCKQSTGRGNKN